MKFVHIDTGVNDGEELVKIEWRNCERNAPVSEFDRERWVNEIVQDMIEDGDNEPYTRYTTSGDSMVVVCKDEEGRIEVYDCKLRRAAYVEED